MDENTGVNWDLLRTHYSACMDELGKAIRNAAALLRKVINNIANSVRAVVNSVSTEIAIKNSGYPKRRIIWLALHHKSYRVRKKNRKRILKWLEENK